MKISFSVAFDVTIDPGAKDFPVSELASILETRLRGAASEVFTAALCQIDDAEIARNEQATIANTHQWNVTVNSLG